MHYDIESTAITPRDLWSRDWKYLRTYVRDATMRMMTTVKKKVVVFLKQDLKRTTKKVPDLEQTAWTYKHAKKRPQGRDKIAKQQQWWLDARNDVIRRDKKEKEIPADDERYSIHSHMKTAKYFYSSSWISILDELCFEVVNRAKRV